MRHFDRFFATTDRLCAEGTDHLLAAAEATGVSTFVARSSGSFNGLREGGWVKTEQDPLDPMTGTVLRRRMIEAVNHLERHVSFLATTGSVAPFIGLMGTVWGVMVSFVNIGAQGSATLVVVAPGIAEALIATIAGLAAAIPSVIGYNHCLGKLREIGHAAAQFTSEYLDRRLGARHS